MKLDLANLPSGDPTAEALRDEFGSKSFTKTEIIDFIAEAADDEDYAKHEFGELLKEGFICE